MADFEEQLNLLLQEAADIYSPLGIGFLENDNAASKWMNDVQIFNDKYLKEHPLGVVQLQHMNEPGMVL